jgi:perosamine synthetase
MIKYPIAFPILGKEERKYLIRCIDSGWISSKGEYVKKFEASFAKFCGAKYAVSCSNGTVAINLALMALGIKAGDEVIIPDLTFGATANAPLLMGIKPVLVDVDPETWNINPAEIEKNISKKTKAIIPVHLFGLPCDMAAIMKIARKHKLKVIEDAAEAHGASINGRRVGTWGDINCFSFFGNKIITTGEGGMCTTNDKGLYEKMLVFKNHGMKPDKKYWHDVVGNNFRLTNMQAAIGFVQMKKIDSFIFQKRKIAEIYKKEISRQKIPVFFQEEKNGQKSVWWMFTVKIEKIIDIEKIIARLAKDGIDSRPMFVPLHVMPAFKGLRRSKSLQNSIGLGKNGLTLPSNLKLRKNDIEFIVRKLKKYIDE